MVALTAANAAAQSVSLQSRAAPGVVKIEAAVRNASIAPGDETVLYVRVRVDPGYHIQSDKPSDSFIVPTVLRVEGPRDISVTGIAYPRAKMQEFEFAKGKKWSVFPDNPVITARISADANARKAPADLQISLDYQACSEKQCLPPESARASASVTVADATSPPSVPAGFGAAAPASGDNPATNGNYFARIADKNGWLVLLLAVYAAGLGLSLTPCVFPLIPVTLGYFRSQASDNKRRTAALALTYVAGISLTYSVLGVVAASSGALFGSWLSNPFVLGTLGAIVALMGLSMFGLFNLRPPAFIASRSGGKAGYGGAFAMGLLFGVVAAPCTGPATIALLAFAGALARPVLGFLLFFFLAIGLSTPLLALAIFSGNLPRSGVWMDWVKKAMGALLLGVAVWLINPVIGSKAALTVGGVLALVAGLYLGFLDKSGFRPAALGAGRLLFGAGMLLLGVWLLLPRASGPGLKFQPYTQEAVQRAAEDEKPVMIDFSADWCAPCHELEAGAFRSPEVLQLGESFVRLKADVTDSRSPAVKALLARYRVRGVPTVLFLGQDGRETSSRVLTAVSGKDLARHMREALGETATD